MKNDRGSKIEDMQHERRKAAFEEYLQWLRLNDAKAVSAQFNQDQPDRDYMMILAELGESKGYEEAAKMLIESVNGDRKMVCWLARYYPAKKPDAFFFGRYANAVEEQYKKEQQALKDEVDDAKRGKSKQQTQPQEMKP